MIEAPAGASEARGDVLGFEIGKFFQHLRHAEPGSEEIEHVGDADAHPPYARPATALLGIHGDPFGDLDHGITSDRRSIAMIGRDGKEGSTARAEPSGRGSTPARPPAPESAEATSRG